MTDLLLSERSLIIVKKETENMSRPVSIDKKVILEAARGIFLKYGYSASSKKIAGKAGVSEGSLFKHYKTKTDLFMAAMEDNAGISSWEEQLMKSTGKGDIRKNLQSVGLQVLEHLQVVLPRMMMVHSSGITIAPQHYKTAGVPHPIQRLYAVAHYFRAEMKLGRLAMRNPELEAQIFLGTLVHYVVQKTIFNFRIVAPEVYVRAVVDMFMTLQEKSAMSKGGDAGK